MIDFHAHLDLYPDPKSLVDEIISRRIYVLSMTTTPSAWPGTSALGEFGSRIRTAIGLHPQLAHQRITELSLFDQYLEQTEYVGEIGLDGAPEFKGYWKEQIHVIDHILASCSRAGGKIMSIHSRRAASTVLDRLEAFPSAGMPILHWFTGGKRDLQRAIGMGCWFSVGPAMLQSQKSRELVSCIPRERILTESDGPFAKIEGNAAMPWDVYLAITELSVIWKIDESEANAILLSNLRNLVFKCQDHFSRFNESDLKLVSKSGV